ncbi:PROBABLE CONSERVED INTEGRAL MEMBRANE ALANINE AND LEUCINE RICH PROTEIN [Alloactinosynnema sp. L-07]|uniref:DUF3159 domain-containing protein n=1 Tax=Alloactinosynnema sp. L-07 TaxID=1653480 RepID=UPI00065EFA7D|nr:DUF3159 domain-containing protein [Alloactinosynnema sp. L-07]CRK61229.1 PROBABLE CONSERVED INTEGRAL MEMBRANE ALANINE AND LEUCINE RICH PROTEIN [Alloactinosynnema sp. L-07]
MAASSDTLADLLGGRRGAVDATVPPLAFLVGWLVSEREIGWGAAAAVVAAALVSGYRLATGARVTAALGGLAAVIAAALIVIYTGRAEDFFLVRLLVNIASGLAWALSILIRWPLLGVVVGALLGQKTRWRGDPDLLRAYGRASWVWVFGQYTVRTLVFGALWLSGNVVALGVAQVALSWPLVALVVAASAVVLRRSLPADHPGLRHPRV